MEREPPRRREPPTEVSVPHLLFYVGGGGTLVSGGGKTGLVEAHPSFPRKQGSPQAPPRPVLGGHALPSGGKPAPAQPCPLGLGSASASPPTVRCSPFTSSLKGFGTQRTKGALVAGSC